MVASEREKMDFWKGATRMEELLSVGEVGDMRSLAG